METVVNIVLPDIPRIYTALAEWLACLICISEVKRRIGGWEAGRHFDRDAVCAVGIFVSDGRCGGNLVDGLYGGGGRIYVWISCRLL